MEHSRPRLCFRKWRNMAFRVNHIGLCAPRCMLYYPRMKSRDLTLKQILSVPCPTCEAAVNEPCGLTSGGQRIGPHRDRKYSAAEALEAKLKKR